MKIEKITKLKDNKYKLKIDGVDIITYDDVILNYNILYKKDIDDFLYNTIIKETSYYDIYNKALKYALKRVRSLKEMREYLDKEGLEDSSVGKILAKLVDLNIVNDLMYVRSYINDKVLLSNDGINKIRKHLIDSDIDIAIIDEEISKIDSNIIKEKLNKLVLKKINSNHKYSNKDLIQRIINDCINLGYDKEDILDIINNNLKDDYELLIKEYNKQYNKLSKKYSGVELEYKLKQKLYSKGFNYEDIKKEDLD